MKKNLSQVMTFFQLVINWFSKINLLNFSIISLIVIVINFLPLASKLGFYLDDWPQVYSWNVRGFEGIKEYWIADSRWFTWWIQGTLFPILGSRPVFWHLAMLILRWICSILFWVVLKKIWPKQTLQITITALFFSIYPLFIQQSSAVMFSVIWICFGLFLVSLLLMIQSYRLKKWFVPLAFLGLVIDLISLLSYEYFLGLEFLRPLIFLILINREKLPKGRKFVSILLRSLPWLIIDFGYLIWRGFMIKIPTLRSPVIFENLSIAPIQTIFNLIQTSIKDFIQIVFTSWYQTLTPALFDLKIPSDIIAWALAFLVFVVVGIYLITVNRKEKSNEDESRSWNIQALWFGFVAILFGAAPGWATGRSVYDTSGIWNDRFGIASMLGASLFLVGLIFSLVKSTRNRAIIVLTIFLALATGSNFRNANDYRWSATYQSRFVNQLHWRAPSIKPNTSIMSGGELFNKMGAYPTSFALNLMYPSSNPMPKVDYWYFTLSHYFPNNYHELDDGMDIALKKWYVEYSSYSTDSLLVHWKNGEPSCLWILDVNDRYNPFVAEDVKEVLGASNLSRITDEENEGYPLKDIFGAEAAHTWCYYFEKADLAKQYQNWDEVLRLYDESIAEGYNTNYGPELTPFIFGYAMTGEVDKAVELTNISKTMAEKMNPYLCDQWEAIHNMAEPSQALDEAYQSVLEDLRCGI